jgi:hypothetical protein
VQDDKDDVVEYDILVKTERVKVGGKLYHLTEMSIADVEKYQTAQKKRAVYSPSGSPTGVGDFNGIYADLVKRCLRDPESGKLVDPTGALFQNWPASVMVSLFTRCERLCSIAKERDVIEDEAKKD